MMVLPCGMWRAATWSLWVPGSGETPAPPSAPARDTHHPPGAAQRSKHVVALASTSYFLFSWMSLNADRAR